MFDIAWTELAVIAVVALLVIGPKDLPKVLKTIGQMVGKARALAREFQAGVDEMIRESDLQELKQNVEKAASFDLQGEAKKVIDPAGDLERAFDVDLTATEPKVAPVETGTDFVPPERQLADASSGPAGPPASEPAKPS